MEKYASYCLKVQVGDSEPHVAAIVDSLFSSIQPDLTIEDIAITDLLSRYFFNGFPWFSSTNFLEKIFVPKQGLPLVDRSTFLGAALTSPEFDKNSEVQPFLTQVNFVGFNFNTLKQALLEYQRPYKGFPDGTSLYYKIEAAEDWPALNKVLTENQDMGEIIVTQETSTFKILRCTAEDIATIEQSYAVPDYPFVDLFDSIARHLDTESADMQSLDLVRSVINSDVIEMVSLYKMVIPWRYDLSLDAEAYNYIPFVQPVMPL